MTEINGQTSDGFHTFDELYHHRTILFALLTHPGRRSVRMSPWKSRLHGDGSMFDGYFIVGATTAYGQGTYHCLDRYWDLFEVPELERAPDFDGHTPDDTLTRLFRQLTGRELDVAP